MSPEMVGKTAFPEWWKGVVKAKLEHDATVKYNRMLPRSKSRIFDSLLETTNENNKRTWDEFVGLQ
ncbi:MAG: hypothetical protein WEC35_03440 [Nitrosopumilaceae archaeon]